jgi:hypothetical protein
MKYATEYEIYNFLTSVAKGADPAVRHNRIVEPTGLPAREVLVVEDAEFCATTLCRSGVLFRSALAAGASWTNCIIHHPEDPLKISSYQRTPENTKSFRLIKNCDSRRYCPPSRPDSEKLSGFHGSIRRHLADPSARGHTGSKVGMTRSSVSQVVLKP